MKSGLRLFLCLVGQTFSLVGAAWGAPPIDQQAAKLRIAPAAVPGAMELTWEGLREHYYFVEHSSDLMVWSYLPIATVGQGAPSGYAFDMSDPKAFYRLKIANQWDQEPLSLDLTESGFRSWDYLRQGLNPFAPEHPLDRLLVVERWPVESERLTNGELADDLVVRLVAPDGFGMPGATLVFSVETGPFSLLDGSGVPESGPIEVETDGAGYASLGLALTGFYAGEGSVRVTSGLGTAATSLVLPVSVRPSVPAPPAVDAVAADVLPSGTEVMVTWAAAGEADGPLRYEVWRDGGLVGTTENTSYTDALSSGWDEARYTIVTVDATSARSVASDPAFARNLPTGGVAPAGAPELLEATGHQAIVAWEAGVSDAGIAGYRVRLDGDVVAVSPDQRWTFSDLTPETSYSVQVAAIDQRGVVSDDSAALTFSSGTVPPQQIRASGQQAYIYEPGKRMRAFGSNQAWGLGLRYPDDVTDVDGSQTLPVRASRSDGIHSLAPGIFSAVALLGTENIVAQYGIYAPNSDPQLRAYIRLPDFDGLSIAELGAGWRHSFAIEAGSGTLHSWGANEYRQLGRSTGEANEDIQPGPVLNASESPLTGVTKVTGGNEFSVALLDSGHLRTWGYYKPLGRSVATINPEWEVPGPVYSDGAGTQELSGIVDIAAGRAHTLALASDGRVWSFGSNVYGQLGHFPNTDSDHVIIPAQMKATGFPVPDLTDVVAIAAGDAHSLMLQSNGAVWSSGLAIHGQLGYTESIDYNAVPKRITVLDGKGIIAIAAGQHSSYAYGADGTVWAWGRNTDGQLGDGTTVSRATPQPVLSRADHFAFVPYRAGPTASGGVFISTARVGTTIRYAVGGAPVTETSPVLAPGVALPLAPGELVRARPYVGTLPFGDEQRFRMPTVFGGAAGDGFALFLDADGQTHAWGRSPGSLPSDAPTDEAHDLGLLSDVAVRSVSASGDGAMALGYDGERYGWGGNAEGHLVATAGPLLHSPTPEKRFSERAIRAAEFSGWTESGYGGPHSLAVGDWGGMDAGGINSHGQLGLDTPFSDSRHYGSVEIEISDHAIERIALAPGASFASDALGNTIGWGDGRLLGRGALSVLLGKAIGKDNLERVAIANLSAISGGQLHVVGLRGDGTVWTWGILPGAGSGTVKLIPVAVDMASEDPLDDVIEIAAGYQHSLALRADGTVWSWGINAEGALGYSGPSDTQARQVPGLSSIHWIAAGKYFSMAGDASGNIWAWGRNTFGELGDPLLAGGPTPVAVTLPTAGEPGEPPTPPTSPSDYFQDYLPPALDAPDPAPMAGPVITIESPEDLGAASWLTEPTE